LFPISRDPPEGGTRSLGFIQAQSPSCFQFLGIPPKGEHHSSTLHLADPCKFPISRDPPEGGTGLLCPNYLLPWCVFPTEGGTTGSHSATNTVTSSFQFLGIPPKGELAVQ